MKEGFTLIELLVVIAIISLLSGIALGSFQEARYKAGIAAGLRFDTHVHRTQGHNLVSFWALDEENGVVSDDSAGKNNGEWLGNVSSIEEGVLRGAVNFAGGGHIQVLNNSSLQITGNQTISLWLYPTSQNRLRIISKSPTGEGAIWREPDNSGSFRGQLRYLWGDGTQSLSFYSDKILPLNKWTHVMIVRDLDNQKLYWYFNGQKVAEGDANYTSSASSSNNLYIGGDGTSTQRFHGHIDEVKIYNSAATVAEVRKLYAEGKEKF